MTSQPEKWTNRALIAWTKSFFEKKGIENPKLEAEVLLSHATGTSRIELFMNYDDEPSEENRAAFRELVRRRALGEPVAYLVGVKEFYSLPFLVDSNTLIPRPETEQLVLETIEYFKKQGWRTGSDGVRKRGVETEEDAPDPRETEERELKICDVGVGSGCVSVALVKNIPAARIVALDKNSASSIESNYVKATCSTRFLATFRKKRVLTRSFRIRRTCLSRNTSRSKRPSANTSRKLRS